MASLSSVSSCSKIDSVKNWLESFDVCDCEQNDHSTALSSPRQDSWNEDQSLSEPDPESSPKHRQKCNSINDNNQAGQEKGKKNIQDKNKPFYVPRKPHFFEHDLRNWDEDEEREGHKKRSTRKKNDFDSWAHDMFNPDLQKPKSKQEIIERYGYDIRSVNIKVNEGNAQSMQSNRKQKKTVRRQENSTPEKEFHQEHIPEPVPTRKTIASHKNSTNISPLKPNHDYYSDIKSKQTIVNQPRTDYRNDKRFNCKSLTNLDNKFSNAPDLEIVSNHERKKKSAIPSFKGTDNIKNKPPNNYNSRFSGILDKPKLSSLSRVGLNYPRESSVIRDATEIRKQSTEQGRRDTFNKALSSRDITFEKNVCSVKRQSIISSSPKVANLSKTVSDIVQCCNRRESSKRNQRPVRFIDSSLNRDHRGIDPLASVMGYGYYNAADNGDGNEDFMFPKPPDVSADHLSPFIPQHHYYFTNNHPHMYYQQGYENLPMQWGYYAQSNCYQGNTSGITFLKQHCNGNWNNSSQINQLVMSSQLVDANPYYSAPDEVETVNDTAEVEYITSSFSRLSTSSIPRTTHRYSALRSKFNLNQLNKHLQCLNRNII